MNEMLLDRGRRPGYRFFNATERRRCQLGRTAVDSALDLIDRHFAAENAHDIDATVATYTDDILWDDVTHPRSPFRGKQAVAEAYGGILDAIPDLNLRSVVRFQCGEHVVDESILSGHVVGEFAGVAGGGAPVSFRLLHVFDIRDGLIARENAWFDSAAVVRQVKEFSTRPIR